MSEDDFLSKLIQKAQAKFKPGDKVVDKKSNREYVIKSSFYNRAFECYTYNTEGFGMIVHEYQIKKKPEPVE